MAHKFPSKNILSSQEVLALKEVDLVGKIKSMQLAELEQHAEYIMKEMGSSDYSVIMTSIIKALNNKTDDQNEFKLIQNTLEDLLPNKAYFSDIYARLAAIVMSIIARKFKALL